MDVNLLFFCYIIEDVGDDVGIVLMSVVLLYVVGEIWVIMFWESYVVFINKYGFEDV